MVSALFDGLCSLLSSESVTLGLDKTRTMSRNNVFILVSTVNMIQSAASHAAGTLYEVDKKLTPFVKMK